MAFSHGTPTALGTGKRRCTIRRQRPCPIARSLHLPGDAWTTLIPRAAHAGMGRFGQFKKSPGHSAHNADQAPGRAEAGQKKAASLQGIRRFFCDRQIAARGRSVRQHHAQLGKLGCEHVAPTRRLGGGLACRFGDSRAFGRCRLHLLCFGGGLGGDLAVAGNQFGVGNGLIHRYFQMSDKPHCGRKTPAGYSRAGVWRPSIYRSLPLDRSMTMRVAR